MWNRHGDSTPQGVTPACARNRPQVTEQIGTGPWRIEWHSHLLLCYEPTPLGRHVFATSGLAAEQVGARRADTGPGAVQAVT